MTLRDLFVPFDDELQLLPSKRVPDPPLIEWQAVFGDFFFRLKGMEPSVLWCVLGWSAPLKRPLSPMRERTITNRVSQIYASRTFFRVVPFPDGNAWLLVRPRRALVKSPLHNRGVAWKWHADFAGGIRQVEWLSQPQSWFEAWLPQVTDSSLEFARRVAPLTEEERPWGRFVRSEPTRTRWNTLISALLVLSLPAQSQSQPFTWRLEAGPDGVNLVSHRLPARLEVPIAAQQMFELLRHVCPPDEIGHIGWVGRRGQPKSHHPPLFCAQEASAHEKMEAALLWREFAREVGREAEVERLLHALMGTL